MSPTDELVAQLLSIPRSRRGAVLQAAASFRPSATIESEFAIGPIRAAFAASWEAEFETLIPISEFRRMLKPPVAVSLVLKFGRLNVANSKCDLQRCIADIIRHLQEQIRSIQSRQLSLFCDPDAGLTRPQAFEPNSGITTSLAALAESGRRFPTIYADPPWPYSNVASRGAAENHYPTMSLSEIRNEPVPVLAAENSHLHLWTTNGFLREAFDVIEAWGFTYKSCLVWIKEQMGMGNYWRVSHEYLLLGVRGKLTFRSRREMSWIQASRTIQEDTPLSLLASLELSLDHLTDEERHAVRSLGVFQGGAFESSLLAITGFDKSKWPALRRQLELAALIEPERVPGADSPFLRFHPTLAPLLWFQLAAAEQSQLVDAHRQQYYQLSEMLFYKDNSDVHGARAIAWRELPNLNSAVRSALDANLPAAVNFVDKINWFLMFFGFKVEAETLTVRAEAIAGNTGSQEWYLAQSNRGERLMASGDVFVALDVFSTILDSLGEHPKYERAVTLGRLGRCYADSGRPERAESCYREGIAMSQQLSMHEGVIRNCAILQTDLAETLRDQGRFDDAREQYLAGFEIKKELNDLRGQGVTLAGLGTLAMLEGNLAESQARYRDALLLAQRLNEPLGEAIAWHQLGCLFHETQDWDEAERHFREAARLSEASGNIAIARSDLE